MNAPLPIGGRNFRGFSVPEAMASASAASDPMLKTAGGLVQQDETRRKAAQFQQLLQKGLDGANMYVQDVAQLNPTLGTKFAGELQSAAPIIQGMTPDKAGEAVLGLFESWNGQWEQAMKPVKTEPTLAEKEAAILGRQKAFWDHQVKNPKPTAKKDPKTDPTVKAKAKTNAIWNQIIEASNQAGQEGSSQDPEVQKNLKSLYKALNDAEVEAGEQPFLFGKSKMEDHPSFVRFDSYAKAMGIPGGTPAAPEQVTPKQVGTDSGTIEVPEETMSKFSETERAQMTGALEALAANPEDHQLRQAIMQKLRMASLKY